MIPTTALDHEIKRRRTFAIISHPDAGKTTLTEKLLLYGGAIEEAGAVTARRSQRGTASDWLEIERQRGISVNSTVFPFEYRGHRLNLLDTPGHRDFSEDTYRVLTAVDAAVMVIDAGKGIESQTRKLFDVCRFRELPILTFVNKLDRPARNPLVLLDEIEGVLRLRSYAANWPLDAGPGFRGVFDRRTGQVYLFERTPGGAFRAPVAVRDFGDPDVRASLSREAHQRVTEELALLDEAGAAFDRDAVLAGELTPVFFGSAIHNFGVELLLDAFLDLAPPPRPHRVGERVVDPADGSFSGFIFKIQANMDPRHRDRLAFLRVCSGRFRRDMTAIHTRTGETVRLSNSHRIFGRSREVVDEAYPGDIVGLVGRVGFRIGDTLAEDPGLSFNGIPAFAPECFAWLHCPSSAQFKRFSKGLDQLLQEGVVQSFHVGEMKQRVPLLGAVGPLQFDVVRHRLKSEYGVDSRMEAAPWMVLRWVEGGRVGSAELPSGVRLATDLAGRKAVLFPDAWTCDYFIRNTPDVRLCSIPMGLAPAESPPA